MKPSPSVRSLILVASLLLQLSTTCFRAHGLGWDVDLSFDTGSTGAIDGEVNAIALQPNGKLIIGGGFNTVKGLSRSGLARLNADGSGDASFEMGLTSVGAVRSLALQPDGKILVGHASGIARLNPDGSRDTNFVSPSILDDNLIAVGVLAVALQSDDKILIGGYFTIINGFLRNGIARLNPDGSLDSAFDPGSGVQGFFPLISAFAVQSNGKIFIGGAFLGYNGTVSPNIARLNADGSLDGTFNPGNGADLDILAVASQPDGKVLIGGYFSNVNGTNRNHIARLNADGSLDNTFNPGPGTAGGDGVYCIALQPDGRALIGGYFTTVNGTNRNRLARLNADGSLDENFDLGSNLDAEVFALVLQPDGKVLVGCADIAGSGAIYNLLARFNADGSRDGTFDPGRGIFRIGATLMQPDGKLLFTGVYGMGNGATLGGICRLNSDGSRDASFIPDLLSEDFIGRNTRSIFALALQPDGKVLFGGHPGVIHGAHRKGIARLNADGSLDNSFNPGAGVDYAVHSIALQPDGKILIGGYFRSVDGTARPGLARLNPDGSLDGSFVPAIQNGSPVRSIVVQPDGKLLIGGDMLLVGAPVTCGIVRLAADGSLDNSFQVGFSIPGGEPFSVACIVLRTDGKMFIAGNFRIGTYINSVALLDANGTRDTSFDPDYALFPNPGTIGASSLTLQADGRIFVTGTYYLGSGNYIQGIYRLHADGSVDPTFDLNPGGPGGVGSIGLQPDGKPLVTHTLGSLKGVMRPYLARLFSDYAPPSLSIARSNAFVIVSWPMTAVTFQLQETTNMALPNSWSPVGLSAVTNAGQISASLPLAAGEKFFRLKSP